MWTEYERNEVRQQKKALQTDIDNIKRLFLALCEAQTEQVRNAGPEQEMRKIINDFDAERKGAMPRTSPLRDNRSMDWNNLSYYFSCLGSTWMGGRCSTNARLFCLSSYGSFCCV